MHRQNLAFGGREGVIAMMGSESTSVVSRNFTLKKTLSDEIYHETRAMRGLRGVKYG